MADTDYAFDPDDFDDDDNDETAMSTSESASSFDGIDTSSLTLLPLLVVAVYAFVERGVVLGAVQMLIGASGLASAITTAFYIVGAVTVASFGVLTLATVITLLLALLTQDVAKGVLGLTGVFVHAILAGGAYFVFGNLPFLVGVTLTFNALAYIIVLLMGLVILVGTITSL